VDVAKVGIVDWDVIVPFVFGFGLTALLIIVRLLIIGRDTDHNGSIGQSFNGLCNLRMVVDQYL
jgi:hypothetical protein